MKFGFVTCVELGLSCMEAIYRIGGSLELAVTLKDDLARNKSGRIYLDEFCEEKEMALLKVNHINDEIVPEHIRQRAIDWLFIIGWSQIASKSVISSPRFGALGMHPTLLPIGRGRAAIPWAIIKGEVETGVTLFKLDEGVDTGPIVGQVKIPLSDTTDASELYQLTKDAHIALMEKTFPMLCNNSVEYVIQDETKAVEWPGRKSEDGRIDLGGSIEDAERLVRAVTRPYPGAFFEKNEKKIIVWRARILEEGMRASNLNLAFEDGVLECLEWEEVI